MNGADHDIHRPVRAPPGAGPGGQHPDPAAGPARHRRAAGAPVPADRKHHHHHHHPVPGRLARTDAGLRDPAHRPGGGDGREHRLSLVLVHPGAQPDHGAHEAERRFQQGAHRDHGQGQPGQVPAAAGDLRPGIGQVLGRGHVGGLRGLFQQDHADSRADRLPAARGAAAALVHRRRGQRGPVRRPDPGDARLARSGPHGRARHLGGRDRAGAARQQRAGRARPDQGAVRGIQHPGQHGPEQPGRFPRHGGAPGRRRHRAAGRRGHGGAGRRLVRLQRPHGRREGRLLRPERHAGRQPPDHRRTHQRPAAGHQAEPAAWRRSAGSVRAGALHQRLDRRSAQYAARGGPHRGGGDLPVPGFAARGAGSGGDDSAVHAGRGRHHAVPGLLHQPADAAGDGAGHRAGGRRRHRGGGERAPPYRGRQVAGARRPGRRARWPGR
ncbi:Uncharacterised protein [Bordetella parapertussis]|nr:Uncharacterised protein [Bordetella parapertussis]SUV55126.1 Uncharacterised protein [Bordetella parapertussis]SUV75732.1 Uncharacterised protein [Bordetella parapertussis]VEF54519.1 Uncharacterised protein [Bordetella parapertussis]VTR27737.1 Uncharacterised protein [Bordetella parapertussis]